MFSTYKTTNRDTSRTYIGMTEDRVAKQFRRHISELRTGNHSNLFM